MRAVVNAFAQLVFAGALALPVLASAGDERGSTQAGADQWVPSISLISLLTIQTWTGAVESSICRDCDLVAPTVEPLRESASGGDTDVTPFVGGSFELMTPELPIPLSPRFFVGGEVVATFGFDRTLAQEGDPSTLESPLPPGNENVSFREESLLGQGSETTAQLGDVFYGAYAGVSFPFTFKGRQLRLKPSLSWIRYNVDINGLVVAGACLPVGSTTDCNPTTGFQREIRLQASETATFDGLGPGLQLEMDTPRLGPVGSALFLGARAYHILGDRVVTLSDSKSYDDAAGADETAARWQYEADPWIYRVDLGIRFQWLGMKK